MEWLVWMVAVAILGLAAVAASGRLGEFPATVTDTPQPHVPGGALTGADLRSLRFAVVPRGYSMQQVDELLDRVSRQLDSDPGIVEAPESSDLPASASEWTPPGGHWATEAGDHIEAEPQPPLSDEAEVLPAPGDDQPLWRAAEVFVAEQAGDSSSELTEADAVTEAAEPDVIDVRREAGHTESEVGPTQEVTAQPAAEVIDEPVPIEQQLDTDVPPSESSAELPSALATGDVAEEPAAAGTTTEQPVNEESAPAAKERPRAKRESNSAKAKPEPEQASAEPSGDDLEAEIARIGTGQAAVQDYGSALDDLVSKYSFRKVEHWYELPGFDIPAPAEVKPADPEETVAPGEDSTPTDI